MCVLGISQQLYNNFIKDDRYKWLLEGLGNTLLITLLAVVIGIIIGFLVAIVRSSHDKNGSFKVLNGVVKVYLTVIRGTPTMIQLLIMNLSFSAVYLSIRFWWEVWHLVSTQVPMWQRSSVPVLCP